MKSYLDYTTNQHVTQPLLTKEQADKLELQIFWKEVEQVSTKNRTALIASKVLKSCKPTESRLDALNFIEALKVLVRFGIELPEILKETIPRGWI